MTYPASDLELFSNGCHFVIARNVDEAKKYLKEEGADWPELDGAQWEQYPRNKVLRWSFKCREQPHLPVRVIKLIEHYGSGVVHRRKP